MITLREARRQVIGACPTLGARSLTPVAALGCVLSEPAIAVDAVPAFVNSAMDGYAVRAVDTAGAPVSLRVVGAVMAGGNPDTRLQPGEALRVMTGAPLPDGADAVCMLELTEHASAREGELVTITEPLNPGDFVRRPGEDVAAGEVALASGTAIGPAQLGVLVSVGVEEVRVTPKPVVGVLATGDELSSDPGPLRPGSIHDSNRPALLARLSADGFAPVDFGIAADDLASIASAIDEAAISCDAVITVGGVSIGDRDHIAAALEKLGAGSSTTMQVAIKPAKPFAFGILPGAATPVFGLPGNPVSALVSYELLVRPALRKMAGHRQLDRPAFSATAPEGLPRQPDGKIHFVRVAVTASGGGLEARRLKGQGSHQLRTLAEANGLAVVADGVGIEPGASVSVLILDGDRLDESGADWWLP